MHARQELGEELVGLTEAQLAELELPEKLLDAVLLAKRSHKFGALRRQLQYVGRLMRDVDSAAIAAQLGRGRARSREAAARLHALERWRDRLIASDDAAMAPDLAAAYPGCDTAAPAHAGAQCAPRAGAWAAAPEQRARVVSSAEGRAIRARPWCGASTRGLKHGGYHGGYRASRPSEYNAMSAQLANLTGNQSRDTMSDSIKIGLVSISDRASAGVYKDEGIPALEEWFRRALATPWTTVTRLIADEQPVIEATLKELVDREGCHLVLTTGGTGPAPRDVTPEATLAVGDKVMPGFGEQMRQISLHYVPTAILSRQVAVIRGKALIINLPGQPKSIRETLEGVKDAEGKAVVHGIFAAVPYCIDLIGGPYIETNEDVVKAFRPKSALRPQPD